MAYQDTTSNKKRPKLSILIPCYNRSETIKRCLDSATLQPYENIEVVVSDNCSTDGTQDIIQKSQLSDKRIRLLTNNSNLGPYRNWVKCIEAATGDFVHWLWSDDWVEPTFYTEAINRINSDDSQVVSTWNYRCDYGQERYISWRYSFKLEEASIAFQKVFSLTTELPVSPAAYIIPIDSAKIIIEKRWKNPVILECTLRGVGIDSVMILHALSVSKKLSIIQSPSVTFTKSDSNISTIENAAGNLGRCYAMMHLYFLSQYSACLSRDQLAFIYTALRNFKAENRLKLLFGILIHNSHIAAALVFDYIFRAIASLSLRLSFKVTTAILGNKPTRESRKAFFKN